MNVFSFNLIWTLSCIGTCLDKSIIQGSCWYSLTALVMFWNHKMNCCCCFKLETVFCCLLSKGPTTTTTPFCATSHRCNGGMYLLNLSNDYITIKTVCYSCCHVYANTFYYFPNIWYLHIERLGLSMQGNTFASWLACLLFVHDKQYWTLCFVVKRLRYTLVKVKRYYLPMFLLLCILPYS